MTKTEVQLLSKARAVEIKAFAVTGTMRRMVFTTNRLHQSE